MNATQAKALLEPILPENFITSKFTDGVSKCCVLGHLQRLTSENPEDYSEENCTVKDRDDESPLYQFATTKFREGTGQYRNITVINNNKVGVYLQETVKERIMACLNDMIKAGY